MLSPADVTNEPDFTLGDLQVRPAAREVEKDGNVVTLEPRVMQVLLLLARQRNQVVTRDTMFSEIWGGVMVGDDSLNRAVAGVRKITALDPDHLALETIPRTGYRLTTAAKTDETHHSPLWRLDRRTAIGAAIAAGAVGLGWWGLAFRDKRDVDRLIAQAQAAIDYGDSSAKPDQILQRAAAIRPDDARVLGLLAYVQAMKSLNPGTAAGALPAAERYGDAAIAIDPREPNARLALVYAHRNSIGLFENENRLRALQASAPNNVNILKSYWNLLQCVGRSRDALKMVQRALELRPLAATAQYPLAQLLWITGHTSEADRVIDQALKTWPDHRVVRFARFMIWACTGRARAALAMLDDRRTAPQGYKPAEVALWHTSLPALDRPNPALVSSVIRANIDAAKSNLDLAGQAVIVLSQLGAVDAAFEILNELFAVPAGLASKPGRSVIASSVAWRFAPWLFIPPTAVLHSDPRFTTLCDAIGLTEYWEKSGIGPDYRTA